MCKTAALLCLILLSLTSPVSAQTQIHRCIGANGGAVFTDQVCAALKATPVTNAPAPTSAVPVSTPPPTLCAGSIDALRQSVIAAFAARNANRMAGLMLWDGYGRGSVIADIRSLYDLMKQPLLDVDVAAEGAATPPASDTSDLGGMSADPFATQTPAPPVAPTPVRNQLVIHTSGNAAGGSGNERRFSVVHRAGCLWLRSAY